MSDVPANTPDNSGEAESSQHVSTADSAYNDKSAVEVQLNESERSTSEKKSASSIFLSVVGVIACIILIPVLALNIILIVQSFTQESSSIPNIGGYYPLMVQSGSMSYDPEAADLYSTYTDGIEVGDLIICRTPDDPYSLSVGDIVTYWDGEVGGTLVTHRIIEVTEDESGELVYVTKGDANNTADADYLYPENIAGIFCYTIPYLGDVALFMQTVPGLIVCVLLPLALLVVYDIIRRRMIDKRAENERVKLLAELERLKRESGQNL